MLKDGLTNKEYKILDKTLDELYPEKSITKEKKYKSIPVNPKRFDQILKKIGRKKL